MRKLKFHEKKLLKKLNFLDWKREGGHRENDVMRRYHITQRNDYKKFSKFCRTVQKLVNILKQMDSKLQTPKTIFELRYNMGVIPSQKSLALCDKLSVSSFCRSQISGAKQVFNI